MPENQKQWLIVLGAIGLLVTTAALSPQIDAWAEKIAAKTSSRGPPYQPPVVYSRPSRDFEIIRVPDREGIRELREEVERARREAEDARGEAESTRREIEALRRDAESARIRRRYGIWTP